MSNFLAPSVTVLNCHSLRHLFTKLRDSKTEPAEFSHYARRLMRVICEEAVALLNPTPISITTPTGATFEGEVVDTSNIVAVSIIRAGDSLLESFIDCVPHASVGKILIQRDEATAEPVLFYSKLPSLSGKRIVLVDPMLATGGSAKCAIQVLIDNGADPRQLTFITVLSCPEGLANINKSFPDVHIITGACDAGLNEKKYIVPGLGDYGDRFYGTVH